MARATPMINSVAGGEINPILDARVDLKWFHSSCRKLRNALAMAEGGALRRGGTRYIAEVKTSANRTALVPFEFSTTQAYMLEFGDGYIRFYKDKGQITVGNTDAAISNGTFPSVTDWDDRDTGGGVSAHDAGNNRLSLTPGGTATTDIAWREQDVTVTTLIEQVCKAQVFGAPGDYVQARVGSASTGSQLLADRLLRVGYHTFAFTPAASPFYLQFRNQGSNNNEFTSLDKNIQVDNVSLIDNAPLEIGSPYAQADLFDDDGRFRIQFHQSHDVLYLKHPSYPVYKLTRSSHTTWSLVQLAFEEGPCLDENTTSTTLTPGAATGAGVTLTASSIKGINNDTGFQTTDVGRLFRAKEGSTWGWGVIVGWTSTTVVTVDIRSTLTNTNAKSTWQLGLYSGTDGYPVCGMFFEERDYFGGSSGRPNRFDGSASGDFENFTPGVGDADAVAFTIASDQVNALRWMAPANSLILGTAGAEFAASGAAGSVITPTSVQVKLQTRHGSVNLPPALIGSNALLFVQRQARKLREVAFSFEADGYVSEEMSLRARHLQRGGIIAMAWQQEPYGVLWVARADGLLAGFTYLRSQEVTAWHAHPLGGPSSGAFVESIATIPSAVSSTGDGADQLWLIVRRTINGSTKRYIEILEPPLRDDEDMIKSFYVDSGLTYDGKVNATLTPGTGATTDGATNITFTAGSSVFVAGDVGREIRYRIAADAQANPPVTAVEGRAVITAYDSGTVVRATILGAFPSLTTIAVNLWRMSVTTVSGLSHLEGEEVQVLTDGAVHPVCTVASGAITLQYPATYIHVGKKFITDLMPMKPEAGAEEGTAQGKTKRISGINLRLHRTLGCKVGPSEAKLDTVQFRDFGGNMDSPPDLFTGDKTGKFRGQYDTSADILIRQDNPLPFHLLAAMPVIATAEGG